MLEESTNSPLPLVAISKKKILLFEKKGVFICLYKKIIVLSIFYFVYVQKEEEKIV